MDFVSLSSNDGLSMKNEMFSLQIRSIYRKTFETSKFLFQKGYGCILCEIGIRVGHEINSKLYPYSFGFPST